MASETTAAAMGKVGVVRRDPMAMLPFCGYNMADYFAHWLEMGKKIPNPPKTFHVNWFRQDENGKFIWPGFGENLRVLKWIIERCEGKVPAKETPIGYVPYVDDLYLEGLDIDKETVEKLLEIDKDLWLKEAEDARQFLSQFGERLPRELIEENEKLKQRLSR